MAYVKGSVIQFLLDQQRTATGALIGGKVYFYNPGTTSTTGIEIWLDEAASSAANNPYTLDANGTAQLYASGKYRIVIKNAAGVTQFDRDNVMFYDFDVPYEYDALQYGAGTFTQATIEAALTAIGTTNKVTLLLRPGAWAISMPLAIPSNVTLDMPAGSYFTFIGTGAVTGIKVVYPQMFATSGVGTVASPWAGWATGIIWAGGIKYIFKPGYYSYDTAPNWAKSGIDIEGQGDVFLVHTGSGYGIDLTGATYAEGVRVRNLKLIGNDNTTRGFNAENTERSDIENITILKMSAAGIGFNIAHSVSTLFKNLRVSANDPDVGTLPATGLQITRISGSLRTTDCTFINPVMEGLTGTGIYVPFGNNNIFIGGTSESNAKGVVLDGGSTSAFNSFFNLYCEGNSANDILVTDGDNNSFYNSFNNATSGSGTIVVTAGQGNLVDAGTSAGVTIGASANYTTIRNHRTSSITDGGTNTVLFGNYNGTSFAKITDKFPRQPRTMTITITNGTTASTIKCSSASVYNGDTNSAQDNIPATGTDTGVWYLEGGGTPGSLLLLLNAGIAGTPINIMSAVVTSNASATALNVAGSVVAANMQFQFTNATAGTKPNLTTLVDTGDIILIVTYITDL
jgi:hypothetical protein